MELDHTLTLHPFFYFFYYSWYVGTNKINNNGKKKKGGGVGMIKLRDYITSANKVSSLMDELKYAIMEKRG